VISRPCQLGTRTVSGSAIRTGSSSCTNRRPASITSANAVNTFVTEAISNTVSAVGITSPRAT
jgi:hypothetical protein